MFYRKLAQFYDLIFPPEEAKVNFLHKEFDAVKARRILDLACGTGSYTLKLAELGYQAWGTDLEPEMIDSARKKAASLWDAAHFTVGDMREPEKLGLIFDGLFCIGNSLAHLSGDSDLDRALCKMRGVLRENGAAVFQIVNFDRILARGDTDLPLIERQGLRFLRTYRPRAEEKLIFDSVLELTDKDGKTERLTSSVELRPIRRAELEERLQGAGFTGLKSYGDFKYTPYSADSQALVITALS